MIVIPWLPPLRGFRGARVHVGWLPKLICTPYLHSPTVKSVLGTIQHGFAPIETSRGRQEEPHTQFAHRMVTKFVVAIPWLPVGIVSSHLWEKVKRERRCEQPDEIPGLNSWETVLTCLFSTHSSNYLQQLEIFHQNIFLSHQHLDELTTQYSTVTVWYHTIYHWHRVIICISCYIMVIVW